MPVSVVMVCPTVGLSTTTAACVMETMPASAVTVCRTVERLSMIAVCVAAPMPVLAVTEFPNGKVEDDCGVCGGNNADKGCDDVCFSGKVVDECGICGGDGSSCANPCYQGFDDFYQPLNSGTCGYIMTSDQGSISESQPGTPVCVAGGGYAVCEMMGPQTGSEGCYGWKSYICQTGCCAYGTCQNNNTGTCF